MSPTTPQPGLSGPPAARMYLAPELRVARHAAWRPLGFLATQIKKLLSQFFTQLKSHVGKVNSLFYAPEFCPKNVFGNNLRLKKGTAFSFPEVSARKGTGDIVSALPFMRYHRSPAENCRAAGPGPARSKGTPFPIKLQFV